MTIADLGEFGLIAEITAGFGAGQAVRVGVGDDAAVVGVTDGQVAAATDLLLEGRHFRRDWSAAEDIGVKAAARGLADVAAMGADPLALLVGLAVPGQLTVSWARELAAGIGAESARAGACVIGGDVCRADTIVLAVTGLGDLGGRAPVTRGGARPGDVLAVTGTLGWSAAGFDLLTAGLAGPEELITAHQRPQPPYRAGPEAATLGATSMIDISDGLVADLGHVAAASGVCLSVDSAAIAVAEPLRAAAAALGLASPRRWLLTGGEDHAFAATFPPGTALPGHWRVMGEAHQGSGVTVDGESPRDLAGWDHFRPVE